MPPDRMAGPRKVGTRRLVTGLAIVAMLAVASLVGPFLAPHDPTAIDLLHRLAGPSRNYPLGTDQLGRCVLSRMLFAAHISLGWSFASVVTIAVIGTTVGLVAAAARGAVDQALMRTVDVFLAFPTLVLTLAVIGLLGPSLTSAVIGVILAWWASYARFVRGLAATAMTRDYVAASRLIGLPLRLVLWRHVLPQVASPLMVMVSLDFGAVLLTLSTLGFLGLGVQPPTPEWGAMLAEARHHIQVAPHLLWVPGLATAVAVLAFSLTGDGLRERLGLHGMRPQ